MKGLFCYLREIIKKRKKTTPVPPLEQKKKTTFWTKKGRQRNNNSLFAVFKLLFFTTSNDLLGMIVVFIMPIVFSIAYILIVELTEIKVVLPIVIANDPVNFLWYPFVISTISFTSFFYLAIKFNSFKKTVLFKKILIGGINKIKIFLITFIFFFLITSFITIIKILMLMYYSQFRAEIKNSNLWGLIGGFALLITINISLGLFFGNIGNRTGFVAIISFFFMLFLLFFQGIVFDLEIFIFAMNKSEDFAEIRDQDDVLRGHSIVYNWINIGEKEKILRWVRTLNPYQPVFNIIRQAHINDDWIMPEKIMSFWKEIDGEEAVGRPMFYTNYWLPTIVSFVWIAFFWVININLLKRKL